MFKLSLEITLWLSSDTVKQLFYYVKFYFSTCPVGWVGGWVYELKIRLNSASVVVEVEVEVEAELGNNSRIK